MPQWVQTVRRVGVSFVDRLGGLTLLFFRFLLSLKVSSKALVNEVGALVLKYLSVVKQFINGLAQGPIQVR